MSANELQLEQAQSKDGALASSSSEPEEGAGGQEEVPTTKDVQAADVEGEGQELVTSVEGVKAATTGQEKGTLTKFKPAIPGLNTSLLRRLYPIFAAIHAGTNIPEHDLEWTNRHFPWGKATTNRAAMERCVPAYLRALYLVTLGLARDFDSAHHECLHYVHRRFRGSPEDIQV
jgi:hypothetical protein